MSRELPLNAIRVFEAAGRLLSLKKAAEELGVTPSAVSHQITALERFLNLRLLRREGNRVALTAEGSNYLRQIGGNLSELARATRWLKAANGQRVLRISAPPSFTALWLMPRIAVFARAHPDVALSAVSIPEALAPRVMDRFDVAIRYGADALPGVQSDVLATNELFPVCSPQLAMGRPALREPADLSRHTLIESGDDLYHEEANPGWPGWLETAGLSGLRGRRCLRFSPPHLVRQAARDGLGVGLLRGLLVADDVASGALVFPFGPSLPLASPYVIMSPASVAARPDVAALREFLCAEAQRSLDRLDGTRPRKIRVERSEPETSLVR